MRTGPLTGSARRLPFGCTIDCGNLQAAGARFRLPGRTSRRCRCPARSARVIEPAVGRGCAIEFWRFPITGGRRRMAFAFRLSAPALPQWVGKLSGIAFGPDSRSSIASIQDAIRPGVRATRLPDAGITPECRGPAMPTAGVPDPGPGGRRCWRVELSTATCRHVASRSSCSGGPGSCLRSVRRAPARRSPCP